MNGIKYRSAEEMKDSGIEWIGQIPRDWRQLKVKYIVNLRNVKSTYENDNKYLGLENIESWTGRTIECEEDPIVDGISNVFFDNDVLFSKLRPYLAKCTIASGRGLCSSEFLVMQADLMVPSLLKYTLLTNSVIQTINASTYGAKMPRASWDFIKELSLCLPVSIEQRKISNFLDIKTAQFDSIIAKKEQLIAKLEEAKKSLISEVVTGKVKIVDGQLVPRLPEEMKDSGVEWIGMIPKEWKSSYLRYHVDVLTDFTANGSFADLAKNVKYLDDPNYARLVRLTDLRTNLENDEGVYIDEKAYRYLSKSKLYGDEILIANVGAYAGLVCIMPNINYPCSLAPNMFMIKFHDSILNKYFFYSSQSQYISAQLSLSSNASSAQPKLNKENVRRLSMCYPNNQEQHSLIRYLDSKLDQFISIIDMTKNQIAELSAAKQSLITEAVTGKIDLRDWEINEQGGAS